MPSQHPTAVIGCSAANQLEFYKFLEYKYERLVTGGGGCSRPATGACECVNSQDLVQVREDADDNGSDDDTIEKNVFNHQNDSEKTGKQKESYDDIRKVRKERDEAFAKIRKLEKTLHDIQNKGGMKYDANNRDFKQEISVNLNGTFVKINIEMEDTRTDLTNDILSFKEDKEDDIERLLMITEDEEIDFLSLDADDSILDEAGDDF